MLEKNDLILLNEIIHKIYAMEDFEEMRLSVLKFLKLLVPYNQATFYLASSEPGGSSFCSPVGIGLPQEKLQQYIEEFEDIDYTRWIFLSAKSMAYRETDLFSDAKRENDVYYKILYEPYNIHFSAQISIACNETFLGIIALYRTKEAGDFSEEDMLILDLLKDHLTFRLQQQLLLKHTSAHERKDNGCINDTEYILKYHLTAREIEVFGLLIEGLANDKICDALCISPHTLKKHTLNIYKKLGVNSRWELYNLHSDESK